MAQSRRAQSTMHARSRTLGSLIRATPPVFLISAGTLSRAITAQAWYKAAETLGRHKMRDKYDKRTPAFSAILASSAFVTSMIKPPLSIWAKPAFTLKVPILKNRIKALGTSQSPVKYGPVTAFAPFSVPAHQKRILES